MHLPNMNNKLLLRVITGFIIAATIALAFFATAQWIFTALLLCMSAGIMYEWHTLAPHDSLRSWITYPLLPCVLLIIGSVLPQVRPFVGLLFYIVFIHDTCAYLVGTFSGKTKLAPQISPNKTWEGFGGGFAGVGMGLYALIYYNVLPYINVVLILLISYAIAITATTGDLYVSWYKRKAGIKDTGSLLPGHGGILDRCDSLLACAYALLFVIIYYYL